MIRITHVITGLGQGGAESALTKIVLGLQGKGFQQTVISLTTRGVNGDKLERAGIPIKELGMTGAFQMLFGLPKLACEIKKSSPNITQTWLYHADFLGLISSRIVGASAVVWNIRCAELGPNDVPAATRILISILAKLSSLPDAVLFNSFAGLDAHKKIAYKPSKSLVIPNGFDLTEWRPDIVRRKAFRNEIKIPEEIFVVGMVARYHRMKDHACFLKAAAIVSKRQVRVRFVLVGGGIDWGNDELVTAIKKLGLEDAVELLGARSDIAFVMAGFDCLVLTSTSEGFPNVIGEAMATGIPCISTDVGDAQIIMGDTSKVVDVGDFNAIANKIEELMATGNIKRDKLSEQCRRQIKKFSLDSVVDMYAKFYGRLNEERAMCK